MGESRLAGLPVVMATAAEDGLDWLAAIMLLHCRRPCGSWLGSWAAGEPARAVERRGLVDERRLRLLLQRSRFLCEGFYLSCGLFAPTFLAGRLQDCDLASGPWLALLCWCEVAARQRAAQGWAGCPRPMPGHAARSNSCTYDDL